jgi:hypothetical protein
VKIPEREIWKTQNDFSIEIMVRFNKPLNPNGAAIFVNTVGGSGDSDWGWGFVAINNKFGFHVCTPSPTQTMANQSDTISACRWYHLAGVKQGSTIKFYLNGKLKSIANLPPNQTIRTATGPAQFGYHRQPYQNWFDGNIDEFRFWGKALTESEIISKMNDTLNPNSNMLLAYYRFNENGQGPSLTIKNQSTTTGTSMDGQTSSPDQNWPKLTANDTLPTPIPPSILTPTPLCQPGGIFNLYAYHQNNAQFNYFKWYKIVNEDTIEIYRTSTNTFITPMINQTDTFFVSLTNKSFCQTPKIPIIVKVIKTPIIQLHPSDTNFCPPGNIILKAKRVGNSELKFNWFRGYNGDNIISLETQDSIINISNLINSDTIWAQAYSIVGNCKSSKEYSILNKKLTIRSLDITPKNPNCYNDSIKFINTSAKNFRIKIFSDSLHQNLISDQETRNLINFETISKNKFYWVKLSPTDSTCESKFGPYEFKVINKLTPKISNPKNLKICSGINTEKDYIIDGENESNYFWSTYGTGDIIRGQGTNNVGIKWNNSMPKLSFFEIDKNRCNKDTILLQFTLDTIKPKITLVTTLKNDDNKILVKFNYRRDSLTTPQLIDVIRDNTILFSKLISTEESYFIDSNLNTHESKYTYQIKTQDGCNQVVNSNKWESLLLRSEKTNNLNNLILKWNKQNFQGNLINKNPTLILNPTRDSEPSEKYTEISTYEEDTSSYYLAIEQNENSMCYRIVKFYESNELSYSNYICNEKSLDLFFPNLITKTSDNINDFFEIKNLPENSNSQLKIYNRWGVLVYETENYDNQWAGPPGIYFYEFHALNISKQGYINIVNK